MSNLDDCDDIQFQGFIVTSKVVSYLDTLIYTMPGYSIISVISVHRQTSYRDKHPNATKVLKTYVLRDKRTKGTSLKIFQFFIKKNLRTFKSISTIKKIFQFYKKNLQI